MVFQRLFHFQVFGGRDNHGFQMNDFHEFNIKKQLWIKIGGETKGNDNMPAKLSGHTAIVYKSGMYGKFNRFH
jgi:hypothetical protein